MPGDELHEDAAAAAEKAAAGARRARSGPRHAAPRKPLLTRLHMPAGKAIAMAAMPSAVLMGMGLTPQLATAKPLPKNPFREGPCVSAPDKDQQAEADAAREKAREKARIEAERQAAEARKQAEAEKQALAEQQAEQQDGDEEDAGGAEDSGASSGDTGPSAQDTSGDSGSDTEAPEPSPSPSETEEERNPLDPLGLGEKIRDVFTPDEEEQATEEPAEPQPSPSPSGDRESQDPAGDTAEELEEGVEDALPGTGGTQGPQAPESTEEPAAPEEDAGGDSTASPDSGDSGDDATGQDPAAGGKEAFPCVEEKKVAGEGEQTPATLPNQPWRLEASSLALHGLDYKGVYNVRTADGSSKQVLKFTADSVDIGDLHQIVAGDGVQYHVQAAPGSTSTIRGGQVTMYTERLEGKLFGLIPIVFDPEHPPPLNLPEVYFTEVTVRQAGQFGGNLTVPGLHSTITR
ncbi:hypothetical protein [Streptomyces sp. JJ36]|uniref:hypothetical protein n=1 Tax=Streptomyces sp. JJ36 TaxID=2736645 RepID=UPI001F330ECE|nr:hypothetical protein [Streptomyces sp. JJ36]MCF6524955.1 hypothetical protein [Streptomyces sp. JJ36]